MNVANFFITRGSSLENDRRVVGVAGLTHDAVVDRLPNLLAMLKRRNGALRCDPTAAANEVSGSLTTRHDS